MNWHPQSHFCVSDFFGIGCIRVAYMQPVQLIQALKKPPVSLSGCKGPPPAIKTSTHRQRRRNVFMELDSPCESWDRYKYVYIYIQIVTFMPFCNASTIIIDFIWFNNVVDSWIICFCSPSSNCSTSTFLNYICWTGEILVRLFSVESVLHWSCSYELKRWVRWVFVSFGPSRAAPKSWWHGQLCSCGDGSDRSILAEARPECTKKQTSTDFRAITC